MVWTIRVEGRRDPILEIPHSGPNTVRTVELVILGLKSAGLVAIVNFTKGKQQVNRWLMSTSSE